MNILLKTKQDVETHFGKQATFATNILSMVGEGEKAYGFLLGSMEAGFDVTVGFFNDKARYVVFHKRSGKKWEESDVRFALMQIGSFSNWSSKPGSEFFDYAEKIEGKPTVECTGWHTPKRRYAFVFIPVVDGEIGIFPDRSSIDPKFAL